MVFVGNGPAWAIKAFKEDLKIAGEIYTDPSLEVFKAAQMKRGKWLTFGPRSVVNAAKLFMKGFRQTEIIGDPYQQGGVVIVRPDNQIVYTHANEAVGDEAPIGEIVKALQ